MKIWTNHLMTFLKINRSEEAERWKRSIQATKKKKRKKISFTIISFPRLRNSRLWMSWNLKWKKKHQVQRLSLLEKVCFICYFSTLCYSPVHIRKFHLRKQKNINDLNYLNAELTIISSKSIILIILHLLLLMLYLSKVNIDSILESEQMKHIYSIS